MLAGGELFVAPVVDCILVFFCLPPALPLFGCGACFPCGACFLCNRTFLVCSQLYHSSFFVLFVRLVERVVCVFVCYWCFPANFSVLCFLGEGLDVRVNRVDFITSLGGLVVWFSAYKFLCFHMFVVCPQLYNKCFVIAGRGLVV